MSLVWQYHIEVGLVKAAAAAARTSTLSTMFFMVDSGTLLVESFGAHRDGDVGAKLWSSNVIFVEVVLLLLFKGDCWSMRNEDLEQRGDTTDI